MLMTESKENAVRDTCDLVDNINFTLPTVQYPSQITALAVEIATGPRYTDIIEETTPDLSDFPVTHSMAPVIVYYDYLRSGQKSCIFSVVRN